METKIETNPKKFWNRRSKTFPRYTPGEDQFEAGMLRLIRERGGSFEGLRVLDVGCGCGMYTIRLAQEAAWVTALDISDEMLGILKQDAEALGLSNLEYVNADWLGPEWGNAPPKGGLAEIDHPGTGLITVSTPYFAASEPYDLVFCSMTPALSSEEGKLKALGLTRGRLVFIGNSGLMCSNAISDLYAHYGVSPKAFNNGPEMRAWLDGRGLEYFYQAVKGEWTQVWSKSELTDLGLIALENYGLDPDPVKVADYIEKYRVNGGQYQDTTPYHLELIIIEKSSGLAA